MEKREFFERFRMLSLASEPGDLLKTVVPVGLLPYREKYVDVRVFSRLVLRPKNNSLKVFRYLSDRAQYSTKFRAAFTATKKLQMLLKADYTGADGYQQLYGT